MITTTTLALGGIVAAVVAGWQQVKNIFSYLSSFIVVRATVDSNLIEPLRLYLKNKWTPLPSGQFQFISRWYTLKGTSNTIMVPFRLMGNSAIWYRKGRILITNYSSNRTTMITLRGLVDLNKIISETLDFYYTEVNPPNKSNNRFFINKVIGMEKGAWAAGRGRSIDSSQPTTSNESKGIATLEDYHFNERYDLSFKYKSEEYLWEKEEEPFAGLFYPPEIMKHVEQAKQWLTMGNWYQERKIPWRRGWLVHGPGGTGKSSLAKEVARMLGIPIYHYYLATLSDQEFIKEWREMAVPCMVLFEDFDTIFDKRTALTEHKSLTFDCILNQISGVEASNGIFLVVTTNHVDKIDEAMGISAGGGTLSTRPGRIDTVIEVGYMQETERRELAKVILKDWPNEIEKAVKNNIEVTPVQFQEICIQIALEKIHNDESIYA